MKASSASLFFTSTLLSTSVLSAPLSIIIQQDKINSYTPEQSGTRAFPAHGKHDRTLSFPSSDDPAGQYDSALEGIIDQLIDDLESEKDYTSGQRAKSHGGWTIIVGPGYDDEYSNDRSKRWDVSVLSEQEQHMIEAQRMEKPDWVEYESHIPGTIQYDDSGIDMADYITPPDFHPDGYEPAPWTLYERSLENGEVMIDSSPTEETTMISCHLDACYTLAQPQIYLFSWFSRITAFLDTFTPIEASTLLFIFGTGLSALIYFATSLLIAASDHVKSKAAQVDEEQRCTCARQRTSEGNIALNEKTDLSRHYEEEGGHDAQIVACSCSFGDPCL